MADSPDPTPLGLTDPDMTDQPDGDRHVFKESIDDLSASLSQEIEMLVSELRARWRRGDRRGIESLGPAFNRIATNEEQLLDLVYHEVLIREEHGETPHVDEYLARFPQHGERLQRLFAVHGAIEDDWDHDLSDDHDSDSAEVSAEDRQSRETPSSTDWGEDKHKARLWPRKSRNSRPVEPPPGYELLEEIGRGGMAVVFRARQQILHRVVALKMLVAGNVASKEVLARLQQEARVVAQLQHPGIVQIYEVGEHQGSPYLSLEYVAGGTLHEWLDGQPLPPMDAAQVVEELARTVQFAHERGIIHRDLKPSNVLLVERPTGIQASDTISMSDSRASGSSTLVVTKISDFGLARILGGRSDLTATGQVLGTPSYMAPEQTASSCTASAAQDVYSLGAILYELLVGRPPFRGATLFETLEQVRSNEPVPPRRLQPRVPRDLETICLKCLEKLPSRRYPTALALAEDLLAVQQGDTITARPAGPIERTWKLVVRHPTVSSLIVLAVLVALVGVGGIWQEAVRANQNEVDAKRDRDMANRLRLVANSERDEAKAQRERAIQQTQIAEEQQQHADEQRVLAETARARAQELQLAAEANLDQALDAINSLARFGSELQGQPRQQAISQRILDDTLTLYTKLESEHGDNPRLRRQLAGTLTRAGELRAMLRENDKADELLRRAIAILEEELQYNPGDIQLLNLTASASWHHGNLLRSTERPKEALGAYRRCVAARDAVLAIRPDPYQEVAKANTLVNECVALLQVGRPADAVLRYEEAITILRGVIKAVPGLVNAYSELSLALHDYSRILRMMQRAEDSQKAFQESFDLRKRLYQRDSNSVMNRVMLARLHTSQGYFDREMQELPSGIAQFQQAIPLLAGLVESYPTVYDYQRDLHLALVGQVEICLLAGNAEVGKPAWQDLVVRLQTARKLFPHDKMVAARVVAWLPGWSDQLWEDGQQNAARQLSQLALESALWLHGASLPTAPEKEAMLANDAAWLLATTLETGKRDLPKAKELAQRAVRLSPNSAACLHTLGTILIGQSEPAEAKKVLTRAITLEKQAVTRSPFGQLTKALLALPQGNGEEAREAFEMSVGFRKQSIYRLPALYATLAVAQSMLNEQEAARSTLKLVVNPPRDFSKDGAQSRRLIDEARKKIGLRPDE